MVFYASRGGIIIKGRKGEKGGRYKAELKVSSGEEAARARFADVLSAQGPLALTTNGTGSVGGCGSGGGASELHGGM